MARELPQWASRLREERVKRLWSQKVTGTRLRDAADERTRARLPSVESITRRVRSFEAGDHSPSDLYAELYCRAFGLTREALFAELLSDGRQSEPTAGVRDAAGLAAWITATNISDDAITYFDQQRLALAQAHTQLPPAQVLADVLELHGQLQTVLQGGRQRLRQTRDLFRAEADVLAHASLLLDDVDHPMMAQAHCRTAMLCAGEAGSSPALALSAQAKTARWQGVRRKGRESAQCLARSADLARRGYECSAKTPVSVLLAGQEASAAALLGDTHRARRALGDAEDAASRVEAGTEISAWTCPSPRRALYALSVAIRLGDPDAALRAAGDADAGWAGGEPRLYGVWSLVRIGAAIAWVMKGDVTAAASQLDGVLALAPAFRISTMTGYLADLDSRLTQRRFATVAAARDLLEQIAAFTAAAHPAAPTSIGEVH